MHCRLLSLWITFIHPHKTQPKQISKPDAFADYFLASQVQAFVSHTSRMKAKICLLSSFSAHHFCLSHPTNIAFGGAPLPTRAQKLAHTPSMWSKANMTFLKGSVLAQGSMAGPALKGPVRDFISTAMCLKGSMARSGRQPCHNGSTHSSPTPASWQQNTSSLLPVRF